MKNKIINGRNIKNKKKNCNKRKIKSVKRFKKIRNKVSLYF